MATSRGRLGDLKVSLVGMCDMLVILPLLLRSRLKGLKLVELFVIKDILHTGFSFTGITMVVSGTDISGIMSNMKQ